MRMLERIILSLMTDVKEREHFELKKGQKTEQMFLLELLKEPTKPMLPAVVQQGRQVDAIVPVGGEVLDIAVRQHRLRLC